MIHAGIAATITSDISKLEFSIDRFECESVRLLKILDKQLEGRDFLCGNGKGCFTLADMACYGYAASHWWAGIDIKQHNLLNVVRWLSLLGEKESIRSGCQVPGVSNFGEKGPLFEEMRTNIGLQEKVENHAKEDGRFYFGWKDLAQMFAENISVPFASHVKK